MMGRRDDTARQYDTDWSSANDVDDDEQSSVTPLNHYDDVSNIGELDGSDVSEESDGETSQYSDDDEVKHRTVSYYTRRVCGYFDNRWHFDNR
ncbi:hypothetical protein DPMN_030137 [Dreissena polymorpha]|uniref:Uncharacterized protein n=1 Tax=Dreissena polymorpha TaxID=45954 RepID=A0A9D4M0J0_DREPO|nr:hypothetical protein DPMN_030137 [Dreissena polymorpha]